MKKNRSYSTVLATPQLQQKQHIPGNVTHNNSNNNNSNNNNSNNNNSNNNNNSGNNNNNGSPIRVKPGAETQKRAPASSSSSSSGKKQKKSVTLNDFEIGEMLGQGAFSRVHLATHKATGRKLALKIVEKKLLVQEKKEKTIKMERDALLRMNHPNIIKLYYCFSDAENLYLGIELAPGGEFFTYISKYGPLSLEATRFYIAEIINGLEYMHGIGILHRDMKPENIIFDIDMHTKITDFGTAKIAGVNDPIDMEVLRTKSKQTFCGTAEYVSPEVLRDLPCTEGSDLWALGCIIYQCLTREHPFKGASQYMIFQKILERDIQFPDHLPPVAIDIINKLLQIEPSKRLGVGRDGYKKLKAHPFFNGIDFERISEMIPPPLSNHDKPEDYSASLSEYEKEVSPSNSSSTRLSSSPTSSSPSPLVDSTSEQQFTLTMSNESSQLVTTYPDLQLKPFKVNESWKAHLLKDEKIVLASSISKKRRLSVKKRNLILTDKPRLIYVGKNNFKGHIPWTKEIQVKKVGSKDFLIKVPGRDYMCVCESEDIPEQWELAVEYIKKKM